MLARLVPSSIDGLFLSLAVLCPLAWVYIALSMFNHLPAPQLWSL